MESELKDFFISYNHDDQDWAEWVAFQLEKDDRYSVMLQAWDWGPGNDFVLEMQKAAEQCRRTILILSPAFLKSKFTQPEWSQAFRSDPTGEKRLLIPIRVQECDLKGFFGSRVHIDFLQKKPPEISEQREHLAKLLLDGVAVNRKKPLSEPSVPPFKETTKPPSQEIANNPKPRASSSENSNLISSSSRKQLLKRLEKEWLLSTRPVALLEGFPGTGKTSLALSLPANGLSTINPIQVGENPDNQDTDLLINLAISLEEDGFDALARELEKGVDAKPFEALNSLIRRTPILVVIDEFQNTFIKGTTNPSHTWQKFIESLNNAASSKGKILLISNRIIPTERWTEHSLCLTLTSLPAPEAADFLSKCLEERGILDKVPTQRLTEIGVRLGGNPRALKTLVGSLVYSSIEDLVSEIPEKLEIGDVHLQQQLLEKFERTLISRAIGQLENQEIMFMRWLSINRLPFSQDFYTKIEDRFSDPHKMRINLIDRFLLEARCVGDVMHPLAREISVTRLREDLNEWQDAHSSAADVYFEPFRKISRAKDRSKVLSFVELRHHLFEADRLAELASISERMRTFILSSIGRSSHSKAPENTEILAEHIMLIESLSDEERTKELDFHLALCLKKRNGNGDYIVALRHARSSVGPKVYYAAWLLLAELEFTLNGSDALEQVAERALEHLGSGSNAFAIYHHCAQLLDKDGETDRAISFLKKGIKTPKMECRIPLITLCAKLLEKTGGPTKANELLSNEMEGPALQEAGLIYAYWAKLLTRQEQHDDAIEMLNQGIGQEEITKLFSLYLIKADVFSASGRQDCAERTLREGISDKRVIDPVMLYRKLAGILAEQGRTDEAVSMLQEAAENSSIRNLAPLFHSTAKILESSGEFERGAQLLSKALRLSRMRTDHTIYLACSKMYFRAQNLEEASKILDQGLAESNIKERNQLVIKLAEIMSRRGLTAEAIELLQDTVENGSDPRHQGKIYQFCSELLTSEGEIKASEDILRKGIEAPAITDKAVLVQTLAKNLTKQNRANEAVQLLQQSVKWPGISGIVILYQVWAKILVSEGKVDDAISVLSGGIRNKTIGNLGSLYRFCAEIMISVGREKRAIEVLKEGALEFPKDQGITTLLAKLTAE